MLYDTNQARVLFQANLERVVFRQAATAHKDQQRLEQALLLQQQQHDREDRLDQLRAQVCVLFQTVHISKLRC